MAEASLTLVRVWDLPTRAFHWALAACAIGLLVTGKIGGAAMAWHAWLGYAVGSLLLFRIAWGLVGGHWSRFAVFTYSPRALVAYLRGHATPQMEVGHSPLAAASVYALLFFLSAQFATGLFSDDQADFTGALNILVSNRAARLLTSYHKDFGQWILIALVLLHVGAVAYHYLRKGRNLLGPMVSGDKQLPPGVPAARDDARSRWLALALLALSSGAIAWLVSLGGQ